MMYTFLFADIILVLVLQAIVTRSKSRLWGVLATCAVALVCLVPEFPRIPMSNVSQAAVSKTPTGVTTLTHSYIPVGDSVITYPYPATTLDAMLWQGGMDLPFKMPGAWFRVTVSATDSSSALDPVYFYGTTSTAGEVFVLLQQGTPVTMSQELRSSILDELRGWKIHWVLASCSGPTASTDRMYLTQLFGRPTHVSSGAYLWHVASS